MNKSAPTINCWPTSAQRLLLRASLWSGKEALEAWHEWKSTVDVESIDAGSIRLLPLLHLNLSAHGITDPLMKKFKGVYRMTWYKNHILFHNLTSLLSSFHTAGIQTMLLKGTALILQCYKDYGLRPMNDFDVLVRTEEASAAINVLRQLGYTPAVTPLKGFAESNVLTKFGWTEKPRPFEGFTKTFFSARHAHVFRSATNCEFDLHWHILSEVGHAVRDDDFWDGAIPTRVNDISTHVLNPTDQLFHICVHGARWNSLPPLRWAADAVMVIKTSPSEIDWNRLILQAIKHRLILPLHDTLTYLHDQLNVPVPRAVLQDIQKIPVSKMERMEHSVNTCSPGLREGFLQVYFDYKRYSRLSRDMGLTRKLIGFPGFLQQVLGFDSVWQIPFYMAFEAMRRILPQSLTKIIK